MSLLIGIKTQRSLVVILLYYVLHNNHAWLENVAEQDVFV
jgi:hypothetical protein